MLIRDLNNTFFFTTSAFIIKETISSNTSSKFLTIESNTPRETHQTIYVSTIPHAEVMNHIYKCYKRADRCCDLNDLLKKDNKE